MVCAVGNSQFALSGRVLNIENKSPVPGARITIAETELWATADRHGRFQIKNIPAGNIVIGIEYLDFINGVFQFRMSKDIADTVFYLRGDNLTMDEVTVTSRLKETPATSFFIDRKALDHLQMLSVTDASALLPGGKTNRNLHLATSSAQNFFVIGNSGESGNPAFGVGVEVDGTRLSQNAFAGGGTGVDLRNIASTNVESMEIITGLPSVEYGDLTNGLVKINSRKGASPYILDLLSKPNTKQVALSKGFKLKKNTGTLNVNLAHTRSISNIASPYTAYSRNSLSLSYSNTIQQHRQPIHFTLGLSGNAGGYSSKSDPDKFVNTYSKAKDQVFRANASLRWLLQKKWITNLEAATSVNYNNKFSESNVNRSSPASVAAIHSIATGYFVGQTFEQNPNADIILVAPGYWYQLSFTDSRVLNYAASVKARWYKNFGKIKNNLMIGGAYDGSRNLGSGLYYADMRVAPTWRPYRYKDESALNNFAAYLENGISVPVNKSLLRVTAGVRSDFTFVSGSEYGTVGSVSPRVNAQYIFWKNKQKRVSHLSIRAGWGQTVKLPSFGILFPAPQYRDILAFAPGTTATGEIFYAYYSTPYTRHFNPQLKWQSNLKKELATDMEVMGNKITLIYAIDKTKQPFSSLNLYEPFTYRFTDQTQLENVQIPIGNRVYSIDKNTGVVTVSDHTGVFPSQTIGYRSFTKFNSTSMPVNGADVIRKKLSWIIDLRPVRSIRTSFRIDGAYYTYRVVDEMIRASMPNSTQNMADGNPYKYIGFYVGGASLANGEKRKSLDVNLTAITHIPSVRLIVSARIESSLYDYAQNLSEYSGGTRGFVIDDKNSYLPSANGGSIYSGNRFAGLYPLYFTSLDDMQTKIPFAETFLWAKENDPALYNELAKLVERTNYNYFFNANKTTAYYSANMNVTKELGTRATITFSAINFLNNLSQVRSTWTGNRYTLYDTSLIPQFYYGISFRLKI